jgi:uncharacterized membrane protein YtjA (UPF0391 family)
LYLCAAFLLAAAFFAIFGFGDVFAAFAQVARILFFFFLLACAVTAVLYFRGRRI